MFFSHINSHSTAMFHVSTIVKPPINSMLIIHKSEVQILQQDQVFPVVMHTFTFFMFQPSSTIVKPPVNSMGPWGPPPGSRVSSQLCRIARRSASARRQPLGDQLKTGRCTALEATGGFRDGKRGGWNHGNVRFCREKWTLSHENLRFHRGKWRLNCGNL